MTVFFITNRIVFFFLFSLFSFCLVSSIFFLFLLLSFIFFQFQAFLFILSFFFFLLSICFLKSYFLKSKPLLFYMSLHVVIVALFLRARRKHVMPRFHHAVFFLQRLCKGNEKIETIGLSRKQSFPFFHTTCV